MVVWTGLLFLDHTEDRETDTWTGKTFGTTGLETVIY